MHKSSPLINALCDVNLYNCEDSCANRLAMLAFQFRTQSNIIYFCLCLVIVTLQQKESPPPPQLKQYNIFKSYTL